jgi:hypothetical protein
MNTTSSTFSDVRSFYPSAIDAQRVYDPQTPDVDDDDEDAEPTEPTGSSYNMAAIWTPYIQVAFKVGALWNIPCILYDCCTHSDIATMLMSPEWESLSAEHQHLFLVAHNKQKHGARAVQEFLLTTTAGNVLHAMLAILLS